MGNTLASSSGSSAVSDEESTAVANDVQRFDGVLLC